MNQKGNMKLPQVRPQVKKDLSNYLKFKKQKEKELNQVHKKLAKVQSEIRKLNLQMETLSRLEDNSVSMISRIEQKIQSERTMILTKLSPHEMTALEELL